MQEITKIRFRYEIIPISTYGCLSKDIGTSGIGADHMVNAAEPMVTGD